MIILMSDYDMDEDTILELTEEELTYLQRAERCESCGHWNFLHDPDFCWLPDCECGEP